MEFSNSLFFDPFLIFFFNLAYRFKYSSSFYFKLIFKIWVNYKAMSAYFFRLLISLNIFADLLL